MKTFFYIGDHLLFYSSLVLIAVSLYLTVKTRFIQLRMVPTMFRTLAGMVLGKRGTKAGEKTVRSHKALFTAMSTTIGISSIVSPVVAIRMGGPGAVLGFLVATFFGAAVNYTEVRFALRYRKRTESGEIRGGPMQYLADAVSPFLAKWYALFTFLLMMIWSAAQSNQLAQVLTNPSLGSFHIAPVWTGLALALFVTLLLMGGIQRIANFSSKLVPVMFCLYVGASLWILLLNIGHLPHVISLIFESALSPQAFGSGAAIGGVMAALRWGILKGIHVSEAGVGTQTIPHSMAATDSPEEQGILSMFSGLSAGFVCLLSSLVALVTESWLNEELSLGINMVAHAFTTYFSFVGIIVVLISAMLFAFGTILGNSFNGEQCFFFLTKRRFVKAYYLATAVVIFFGSILDVALVWSLVDYFVIPVVLPHVLAIAVLSWREERQGVIAS